MTAGSPERGVEAVVFDWGGTLTPWHTVDLFEQWHVFARAYLGMAGDDGSDVDHAAVARRIIEAEDGAWKRAREQGLSARISEILDEAGVDPDHELYPSALTAYQGFWEPHTLLDPDVPALWQGLRDRDVKVGVLSNTIWTREYHEQVFRRDGVLDLIDGAVYSSEIDYTKPHPEAFAAALGAVGVDDPATAVYVGDRPFEDVHGGQQMGMRAVLVPHSDIPLSQQVAGRGRDDVVPDAVVERLADLLDVVDGWR